MTDLATVIAQLEAEQKRLTLSSFDEAGAWDLGTLALAIARERDASVTIDIRRHQQILFHAALAGTSADNDRWVERKSRTVFHFGQASWLVRHRFLAEERDFDSDSGLDPLGYAAHGGSVPLIVRSAGVVAALTVSGLPQRNDHELAAAALGRFASR